MAKNSCTSCSPACTALNWIVCLVFFLAMLASLTGVYQAHFGANSAVFGSTSDSLSLIALGVTLSLWAKWMCKCLCTCEK